jgi:hypothetical protein
MSFGAFLLAHWVVEARQSAIEHAFALPGQIARAAREADATVLGMGFVHLAVRLD